MLSFEASAADPILASWTDLSRQFPPGGQVALEAVLDQAGALADLFYAHMMADEEASLFLSSEQVQGHLQPSLQRWMRGVLLPPADPQELQELAALQHKVGEVHARIGVPVNLVARGARFLKQAIFNLLDTLEADAVQRTRLIVHVTLTIDLALELMTLAYTQSRERSIQADESYRHHALTHNISTERERQRAALLDWENDFVYRVAIGARPLDLHRLASSKFGLWFHHTCLPNTRGNGDLSTIANLIADTDRRITDTNQSAPAGMLAQVRENISQIKFLLNAMFERLAELESGRDTLTQLLNRRFVSTVLRREVSLAQRNGAPFALALLDIDHFKAVNDEYGHQVGDRTLQAVANVLREVLRGSDYAFRYGGEEFLLVLVETTESQARVVAERVRQKIESLSIETDQGRQFSVTASLGIALYDGHPDYRRAIDRADAALYRAKHGGRNRTEIADAENTAANPASK